MRAKSMFSYFLPSSCLSCHEVLAFEENHIYCSTCFEKIERLNLDSVCTRCGDLLPHSFAENHTCGECLKDPPDFEWARSVFVLKPVMTETVHGLKYEGNRAGLKWLGNEMARTLESVCKSGLEGRFFDGLVPVPLHSHRLVWRGYNQALWLGQKIAKYLQTPLQARVLKRIKNERSQVHKNREERRKQTRGAFEVTCPQKVRNKNLLLIDDVYTTGATTRECARVLHQCGARVFVLTLARTPLRDFT